MSIFHFSKTNDKDPELLDGLAMILDEGNGDGESVEMASHALDGARRISCFGERIAELLAESFIGGKVDVLAPCDVVRVEEE